MAGMPYERTWQRQTCGCGWSDCLLTVRITTRTNHDQPTTGTVRGSYKKLGSIIVVHPGHPLVGRTLPVVRRYRHGGVPQWVIELPDGSRQYVPASWCALAGAWAGSRSALGTPMDGSPPPPEHNGPVLSLSALRDLAALVRHLQEAHASREGAQQDAAVRADAAEDRPQGSTRRTRRTPHRQPHAARVGELCGGGAPPGGAPADPGSPS